MIENSVDKSAKSLQEWRNVAAKSKKQSFACARDNERLQDLARLQSMSSQGQQMNNKSSNHQMTEKEANKLETRRRKSEDASRRADTEFYTISVRAERARLEYESTIRKGAKQMELLEEERLSALKDLANVYLAHLHALSPRLQQVRFYFSPVFNSLNSSWNYFLRKYFRIGISVRYNFSMKSIARNINFQQIITRSNFTRSNRFYGIPVKCLLYFRPIHFEILGGYNLI